jgi:hypothetical protein
MSRMHDGGLALAAMALTLGACAENPLVSGQPKVVEKVPIAPYAIHEDCADLAPGDRLDYRFATTEPVAFNIHYHDGNAVVMPISREGATSDAGVFAPLIAEGYCLMWEAGPNGAVLDYRIALRRGPR